MDKIHSPCLIIYVGNIGSGKSSRIRALYKDCQIISRDELRYHFGCGDYLFDYKVERVIQKIVLQQFITGLKLGNNIVIDETNMNQKTRLQYLELAQKYAYHTMAIVFPDLGEDEHVRRRMSHNHGDTPEEVWRDVYRRKQSVFEMPTTEEGFDTIQMISKESCYE